MASVARGFSLIEATAMLAIAGVAMALALPSLSEALARQRVTTTLHLLSADMAMARSTAIMRRSQVVVCPRGTSDTCADDGTWSAGWLVFVDDDQNRLPDTIEDLLRSTEATTRPPDVRLLSSRPMLRFQSSGRSAHSNLSVHLCAGTALAGSVIVNRVGRVRSERPSVDSPCPVVPPG